MRMRLQSASTRALHTTKAISHMLLCRASVLPLRLANNKVLQTTCISLHHAC